MQQVRIRRYTADDIGAVIALERQWEQEEIAYGDFNPMRREAYVAILERFPAYFLVAECDRQLVGYIHGSVQRHVRRFANDLLIEGRSLLRSFRADHNGIEMLNFSLWVQHA